MVMADDELLHSYLDGTLAEAEVAALESRLRAEPALADALLRLGREEAVMREWASSSATAEAVERLAKPRPARRRSRYAIFVAAAALAVVSAIFVWQLPRRVTPIINASVALLEDVQGDVMIVAADGRAEPAQNGQQVYAGQEVQTGEDDSSTVVRIQDSRVTLGADTRVKIDSQSLFVGQGMVNAEVLLKTLVLRSSLAEFQGREGKFSFVSLADSTVIESDDGQARLTRKSDGHSVDVKRGQFATVKADGKPLESVTMSSRVTKPSRSISVGGAPVLGLAFEPDGSSFVTCTVEAVKRWDSESGRLRSIVYGQKKKSIRSFEPSADGRQFALLNDEKQVKLIDAASGDERWSHKGQRRAAAVALSPDGHTFVVSSSDKSGNDVRLFDVDLGMERVLHTGHASAVTNLGFSPRGDVLVTAGADRSVRLWEADLDPIRTLPRMNSEPRSLAYSSDNRTLAVGDRKGGVWLFDTMAGSLRASLSGHLRDVIFVAFSPDGRLLASASADGTTRLWNVAAASEVASFKGHAGPVTSVAFSVDGRTLATGGKDGKVLFWDVPPTR